MIHNNFRRVIGLIKAREALESFGENEFTTKEFNTERQRGSTQAHELIKMGVLVVSRVETFDMTIEVPFYLREGADVVVNDAGEVVPFDAWEFQSASFKMKHALEIAYNNGNHLRIERRERPETETIQAKRYFYRYNPTAMRKVFNKERKQFDHVIARKKELLDKAQKAYDKVYNASLAMDL